MEIKDQTKRKLAIELLELTIAKNDCAITSAELTLAAMRSKQVNRIAELRLQKMLLKHAEDKAALAAKAS